ncbi:MAG: autotransporter domain-containing protein [Pseudolabrys sp.]|nr:autotransporter domain-containing protein [Pseudolabrys sp.]
MLGSTAIGAALLVNGIATEAGATAVKPQVQNPQGQNPQVRSPQVRSPQVQSARRGAQTPAKAAQAETPFTPPRLSLDVEQRLNLSIRDGKRGLLAGVFDAVHAEPSRRDAVLGHAATLAPSLLRDLTTAADLGRLLHGQPLVLGPQSAAIIAAQTTRTAQAAPLGASAYASPRADNPSPNLPSPLPSLQAQTWNHDLIGSAVAHGRGYTGAGVAVMVGDTGFDLDNKALAGKFDVARGGNYIVNTPTTPEDPTFVGLQSDTDSHGTHVAGIIAAGKFDNVAMHGVAYDSTIIPMRLLLAGNQAPLAEYAENIPEPFEHVLTHFAETPGVMVFNASYGPSLPDGTPPQSVWNLPPGTGEYKGAMLALQAGKIIVAATGNERGDHPVAGLNPSGLALYPFINPAHANLGVYNDNGVGLNFSALQNQPGLIIGVMAVGAAKEAADYSNYCGVTAAWCVAAPGGNMPNDPGIYSTVPLDTYGFLQGTSMAAPTVSGAIAALIQAYPGYNAQDLAHVLFSTTEDLGLPGMDAVFGHGLIRLDRATDGPVTLAAGATATVAAGATTYWSQPLIASGAFSKDGDGVLTVAGRTSAPGNVNVLQGTLAVDGTLSVTGAGNALSVGQAGTLAGFGLVGGNTTIGGVLSPGKMANSEDLIANNVIAPGTVLNGNSAGVLTFAGNVTLLSTATTRIDIDGNLNTLGGPGTFDRIVVSGAGNTFTAGGALTPVLRDSVGTPSNYTPAIGNKFAIVQAVNGAATAGTFSSLVQPVAGLPANGRFDLIYQPTALTLAVTPNSFAAMNLGPQAQAVAGILDSRRVAPGTLPSASSKALYDALYNLDNPAAYDTALTQLSGPGQPAANAASMQAFQGFMGSVGDRQDALASGGSVAQSGTAQAIGFAFAGRDVSAVSSQAAQAFASVPAASPRVHDGWSVWGQGFGRWSTVGDSGTLAGSSSRSGGFSLGADRMLARDLIGGVAFGFARTSTSTAGASSTSDTYSGALYASWTPGPAVVDVRAVAGPSQMRSSRNIMLAPGPLQGNADGFGGGVALEAGYRIALAGVTLKPYAGIAWQGLRRDGYTESQQPFGLAYASQFYDKLTTTIGLAVSHRQTFANGVTLMPEFKAGWAHDLRDTTLTSEAALLDTLFTVNAAAPGRNAALVGFKMSGWADESFRLFAAYNGEFRSNASSHQVSGGARFAW